MNGLDGIIENYLEYAKEYAPILDRYINLYGKDAMYLSTENMQEDEYIKAFGKDKIAFSYSNPNLTKIPVKVLVDYADWYLEHQGATLDVTINFSTENPRIQVGDIMVHQRLNRQYFYRLTEVVQSYNEMLYRCNVKLIQFKNTGERKDQKGKIL